MKIIFGLFLVNFANAQGGNTFLNITNILLSGQNVVEGFADMGTIILDTIDDVKDELNATTTLLNVTTIVNIQEITFLKIERIFEDFEKVLDEFEEMGQKTCYTFPDETGTVTAWISNVLKIELDLCSNFLNKVWLTEAADNFDYVSDSIRIYVSVFEALGYL